MNRSASGKTSGFLSVLWALLFFATACGPTVAVRMCSEGCLEGSVCHEPTGICVRDESATNLTGDADGGSLDDDGGTLTTPSEDDAGVVDGDGGVGGCDPKCVTGQTCVEGMCRCTTTSCDGCCDGDTCQVGNENARCGAGGGACQACGTGDTCGTSGNCLGCQMSCTDGCCVGSTCTTKSAANCGTAGNACVNCGVTADTCDAAGKCACGSGAACATGQRCDKGACICDSSTCASGCCDGNVCKPYASQTKDKCGTGGNACAACDTTKADRCTAGGCMCGLGGVCAAGQWCNAGTCVCDSSSCATGCCDGNICLPHIAQSMGKCGTSGASCTGCDSKIADNCYGGGCRCGTGAVCNSSQRCITGACVCNSDSCPDGCCEGNVCLGGRALDKCGVGGASCGNCITTPATADNCSAGGCRCGVGDVCVPGQRCESGTCICDNSSCSTGCCSTRIGGTCNAGTATDACGNGGATCANCNIGNNTCTSQQCSCNGGAACGAGQRCDAIDGCVCDGDSCSAGCCTSRKGGWCLSGTYSDACGLGGQLCKDCGRCTTCKRNPSTRVCSCSSSAMKCISHACEFADPVDCFIECPEIDP